MRVQEMNNNAMVEMEDRHDQEECTYEEVMSAKKEGRVIQGVFDCARALEMEPESIMMCVLSEGCGNDISVQIQHTLIEAYCWENEIPIKKVGRDDKMSILLTNEEANLNRNEEDHTCALVVSLTREAHQTEFIDQEPWFSSDILLPG